MRSAEWGQPNGVSRMGSAEWGVMKYSFDPIRLTKRATQIVRRIQQSVRTNLHSTSQIGLRAKPAPGLRTLCH